MKKIFFYLCTLVLVSSCIENNPVETYSGPQNIYFSNAYAGIADIVPNSGADSVAVTFAFTPDRTDSLIKIPVEATGRKADQPRKYSVQLDPVSTAKEGVEFDYYQEDFNIPAGSLRDSLQVMLHRTNELDKDTVRIAFRLKANKNFDTKLPYRRPNTANGDSISVLTFSVYSTSVVSQPTVWYTFYMGTFSAKKFYLLGDVTGMDLSQWAFGFFDSRYVGYSQQNYLASVMQRYLDKQAAQGNTIYEKDGTPMVMGQGVQ